MFFFVFLRCLCWRCKTSKISRIYRSCMQSRKPRYLVLSQGPGCNLCFFLGGSILCEDSTLAGARWSSTQRTKVGVPEFRWIEMSLIWLDLALSPDTWGIPTSFFTLHANQCSAFLRKNQEHRASVLQKMCSEGGSMWNFQLSLVV